MFSSLVNDLRFGVRLLQRQPARTMAIGGVVIGITAAIALGRLLADLLYEVRSNDPSTLAATSIVLFAIAVIAAFVPARRVLQVDPLRTLRDE